LCRTIHRGMLGVKYGTSFRMDDNDVEDKHSYREVRMGSKRREILEVERIESGETMKHVKVNIAEVEAGAIVNAVSAWGYMGGWLGALCTFTWCCRKYPLRNKRRCGVRSKAARPRV
jgi:hypothetical protein